MEVVLMLLTNHKHIDKPIIIQWHWYKVIQICKPNYYNNYSKSTEAC